MYWDTLPYKTAYEVEVIKELGGGKLLHITMIPRYAGLFVK